MVLSFSWFRVLPDVKLLFSKGGQTAVLSDRLLNLIMLHANHHWFRGCVLYRTIVLQSIIGSSHSVSYHCSSINNWKFTFCIVPLFSINNWKFTIKRHLILPNHLTRVQNTCKRLKPVNMSLYTHRHSLFTKQWIPDQKDSPYKHTSLYMYSKRYDKSVFVLIN
jgi:hypothetical protein